MDVSNQQRSLIISEQRAVAQGDPRDEFFLTQFRALRDEMVKHIELRDQSMSITLIAFGSLAAAMAQNPSAPFLFLYPILVLFLTSAWSYHERVIRQIGKYIREQVEPMFPPVERAEGETEHLWWENYLYRVARTGDSLTISGRRAASWVFVGTAILALLGGLFLTLSSNHTLPHQLIGFLDGGQLPHALWLYVIGTLADLLSTFATLSSILRATRKDKDRAKPRG